MPSTIYERIDAGEYENNVPYSLGPGEPVDEDRMTVREAREHKELIKQKGIAQRRANQEENGRLMAKFKADLEECHGLVGHPKAAALWRMAWDRGHSSGWREVAYCYDELTELVS